MRKIPLLKPVVEALQRQEAINALLLKCLNEVRDGMGYETIPMSAIEGLIDGDSSPSNTNLTADILSKPTENTDGNTKGHSDIISQPSSDQNDKGHKTDSLSSIIGEKRYVDNLQKIEESGTLGYGCDEYNLFEEPDCYLFTTSGNTASFELNCDMSDKLMTNDRRMEWNKVVEVGEIPECPKDHRYRISTVKPGKATLIDGYYVITDKTEISISIEKI